MINIIAFVEGGVLQELYSDAPDGIHFILVDHDNSQVSDGFPISEIKLEQIRKWADRYKEEE